jgi:hypothetical protein
LHGGSIPLPNTRSEPPNNLELAQLFFTPLHNSGLRTQLIRSPLLSAST